jgi:hypothetical protein
MEYIYFIFHQTFPREEVVHFWTVFCQFRLPINVGYTFDFPIIQYENDTLMIMEACPQ